MAYVINVTLICLPEQWTTSKIKTSISGCKKLLTAIYSYLISKERLFRVLIFEVVTFTSVLTTRCSLLIPQLPLFILIKTGMDGKSGTLNNIALSHGKRPAQFKLRKSKMALTIVS